MADQANEGIFSPYLQKQRIAYALNEISGKVLDFGSGNGNLSNFIPPSKYIGYEVDTSSINIAKENFKEHIFVTDLDEVDDTFNTVAMIAVIEHLHNPKKTLVEILNHSKAGKNLKFVITTPNKNFEFAHKIGAKVGLFSKHAEHEHHILFTKKKLKILALDLNLNFIMYKRFLFGANQICVLQS